MENSKEQWLSLKKTTRGSSRIDPRDQEENGTSDDSRAEGGARQQIVV